MPDSGTLSDYLSNSHSEIPDDRPLWRRINPSFVVKEQDSGNLRVSSQAFQNQRGFDRLSVLNSQIVLNSGRSEVDILSHFDGFFLASVTAGFARSLGQMVSPAPEIEEPAHVHVIGPKPKKVRQALAVETKWVIGPNSETA